MTDRWHQLKKAIGQSGLPAADRQTFRDVMDHGHDLKTADPEPEGRFAPTLDAITTRTGLSRRQVAYSIRHLERHGWITVIGHVGREHRNVYELAPGEPCDCTGRRHTAGSRSATAALSRSATRSAPGAPLAVQRGSATPQLNGPFQGESARSREGFTRADDQNELRTGDLTSCYDCGAEGIVGVRRVVHDPGCAWLAAVRLYEAER